MKTSKSLKLPPLFLCLIDSPISLHVGSLPSWQVWVTFAGRSSGAAAGGAWELCAPAEGQSSSAGRDEQELGAREPVQSFLATDSQGR